MCSHVRPCLGRWHRYVVTSKTMSGTLASYLIRVQRAMISYEQGVKRAKMIRFRDLVMSLGIVSKVYHTIDYLRYFIS
ncbi:hypothetical protein F383_18920 [Gossypium arboreum]|uniref:Uncharacterized protein n=2 Tax=Gossypium arboreum TaxID=29729 RepID=A0A0B0MC68_GOSAR|nr:hypothetical protein F383_18920 [Gossypium arboreum]